MKIIMNIIGWLYPPYGYQRRLREFNRRDTELKAEFYNECLIPWYTETWPNIIRNQLNAEP